MARRGIFLEKELIAKAVSGSIIDFEEIRYEAPDYDTSIQSEVEEPNDSQVLVETHDLPIALR